jgi:hypothetical protein
LLSAAVLLGGLIGGALPLLGLPLAATGLAGLIFSGRVVAAVAVGGLAVALGTFLAPADAVLLAPAFVAMLFAVGGMQRRSALMNVALLTSVVTAGTVARTALVAWLQGTTLVALTRQGSEAAIASLAAAANASSSDGMIFGVDPETLADLMVKLWPFDHFASALLVAVVTVAVAGWAAARTGAEVRRLPRLAVLDLSVHTLWPLIGAFAFLAAGRAFDGADIATTIGLNLLLGVRLLLLAQGLGVAAAFYSRVGIGRPMRTIGYVLLVVADMMLPLVSMVGLVDFWANFRKLPREEGSSASGLEGKTSGQ